jgi:hypothetical protein
VPTYAVALVNGVESVRYINTLETEVLAIPARSVSNTGLECPVTEERVSSPPVAISTKSNINNNKYDSLRFNSVVLSALPERLRTISPGANYEKLLDECDSLGITDEIRRLLTTNRWDNVQGNAGGLVAKIVKDAIERKHSGQLVVAPEQVRHTSPPFVAEKFTPEPRSPETEAIVEETKRKLRGFGTLPR